jgi:TPR repeat protein
MAKPFISGLILFFCASILPAAAATLDDIRVSAAKGDAAALTELGYRYATGTDVLRDDQKALALYRKAAAQGYAVAQTNLGYAYARQRSRAMTLRRQTSVCCICLGRELNRI